MVLPITAFYASLLGICYLYLSFLVIGVRRKNQISLGDGGNEDLKRLSRAHGNFSEYVPITKVQAVYPRRALQRGIQGYVVIEFTVNKIGAVTNPIVVEANPQGIFEQAALDAVVKFKYKPRVINGEPTEVSGVQNRITFNLD